MISVSEYFKQQLIKGNRKYINKVEVTLANGTQLDIANDEIWDGGLKFTDASSGQNSFDVGSAIIGKLELVINDITGKFSVYDFFNATLIYSFGLEGDLSTGGNQIYYRKGIYTVDEATYNGSLITLSCLDNMWRFDLPFNEVAFTSEQTIGEIINTICNHCNVVLQTQTFHNYNFNVSCQIEKEINCREALSYLAQICCCYCKMSPQGELMLVWYNKEAIVGDTSYDGGTYFTTTTPYSDGCDLDGGSYLPVDPSKHFIPYDDGDSADGGTFNDLAGYAFLTRHSSISVGTDDIWISGCRFYSSNTDSEDAYDYVFSDSTIETKYGRYLLSICDNPFVNKDNAGAIATDVGGILAGTPIRTFTASSLNDITYEVGDVTAISDFRGNRFYSFITNLTFTHGNYETFSCGAITIQENKSVRFSDSVRTLAEANKNAREILSSYDSAVQSMNDLAQEAIGYNEYVYSVDGKQVMWRYGGNYIDKTDPAHPIFKDPNPSVSDCNVFKISSDGVFVSTDSGQNYTNGYDANSGTAILNLIYAIGINCDWIKAGTLTLGGYNNQNGLCSVRNESNVETVKLDKGGIEAISGHIGSFTITSDSIGTHEGQYYSVIKKGEFSFGREVGSFARVDYKADQNKLIYDMAGSDGGIYIKNAGDNQPWNYNWGNHIKINNSNVKRVSGGDTEYPYWTPNENLSDSRLKNSIVPISVEDTKAFFDSINPVSFKYNDETNIKGTYFGLIAQDLEKTFSNLGYKEQKVVRETQASFDGETYLMIDYPALNGLELAGIKYLFEEIDSLKREIKQLKERMGE